MCQLHSCAANTVRCLQSVWHSRSLARSRMKLSSNAASSSVSITSSSAPSASAPSWCGGNRSALSSSLSRIPAAEIMTPNRPPASPAPVVVARRVPLAELPRVRKREDLRQNQTVMAPMAKIVEEHLSPHRRPSRTRIPALCKTSATLINQEEAVHFRIHSTVQSGANELRTPVETLFQV